MYQIHIFTGFYRSIDPVIQISGTISSPGEWIFVVMIDQKWAADRFLLLHLPFGTLSLNIFVPWIHYLFLGVCSKPSYIKVSYAIVINSLHNASSDFDLRTYNGHCSLPCISHFALFLLNNLIAWKGRPRCLHLKTKRVLNYYYYYFKHN